MPKVLISGIIAACITFRRCKPLKERPTIKSQAFGDKKQKQFLG